MRVDILVLLLILGGKFSVFHYEVFNYSVWVFCWCFLLGWESSLLSLLHFFKKSLKHIGFCQIFYLLRWSYGWCFLVYYSFLFGSFAVCIPYYALPLVSALLLFLDAKSLYILHPLVETTLISFLSWLKAYIPSGFPFVYVSPESQCLVSCPFIFLLLTSKQNHHSWLCRLCTLQT